MRFLKADVYIIWTEENFSREVVYIELPAYIGRGKDNLRVDLSDAYPIVYNAVNGQLGKSIHVAGVALINWIVTHECEKDAIVIEWGSR